MKWSICALLIFFSFACCNAQEQNEFYLHADHPGFAGAAYGKNINKVYSGINVYVDPFRGRNRPEFTGSAEVGGIVARQFVLFATGAFYTCGGEAKREGEGKQGFTYGVGVAGYYKHFKGQAEITTHMARISIGYFWGW